MSAAPKPTGNPAVTHGEPTDNPAGSHGKPTGKRIGSEVSHGDVTAASRVTADDQAQAVRFQCGRNADEINRHHELARASAITAVNHAEQAGKLLLEVKASMPHGDWLAWLQANVTVSPRQAQRYIAVAEGKTPAIRELAERYESNGASVATALPGKNDTASHLGGGKIGPPDWQPQPTFTPEAGLAFATHLAGDGVREQAFFVEPSAKHPGFWFVTQFFLDGPDDESTVTTARPVRADFVETVLQQYGLRDPACADWRVRKCAGVRIGLETVSTPEQVEAELAMLARKETIPDAIARMKRNSAAGTADLEART